MSRVADFGVFVQIESLVEGLMHVSETTLARGEKPQEHFHEGDPVRARILRIDDAEMKVGLSGLNLEDGAGGRGRTGGRGSAARTRRAGARGRISRFGRRQRGVAPKKKRASRKKTDDAPARGGSDRPERRVMTKAELIERVAVATDVTKKQAEAIVDTVFDAIVRSLKEGQKIELRGFGSFRLRERGARMGRNPKTGVKVAVPAKKIPYFKPGKELKELINR